jgi:hypothetical protein
MKPKDSKCVATTSSKSELDDFLGGNVDLRLVEHYLNLDDSNELARLAAIMAPRPSRFDARALVDAAITLQEEAEVSMVRKRELLASRMNFNTLLETLSVLHVENSLIFSDGTEPEYSDPKAGPLLRIARAVVVESNALSRVEKLAILQAELEELARIRGIPLPPTPCDTITALRFAAHEDNAPDGLLIDAFKEFLGLSHDADARCEDESTWRELQSVQAEIARSKKPSDHQLAELERLKKTVQRIEDDRECRESFSPEKGLPDHLREKGHDLFERHWSAIEPKLSKQDFHWLAKEFHDFWTRHKKSFVRRFRGEEKRRNAISAKRKEVARRGAEAREQKRWDSLTVQFCQCLINRKVRASQSLPAELMTEYFGHLKSKPSKARQEKMRDFFGALWVMAVANPPSDDTSPLRRCKGFEVMSDEAIMKCRDKVVSAIKQAPRK